MHTRRSIPSAEFAPLPATACLARLETEELPDTALIDRIGAGDEGAMQVLYQRYHERILRFACRVLRSSEPAEDVVNEVFLDVWRKAGSFERRSEVATWLFAIARHKCLSVRRLRTFEHWDDSAMELIEDESDSADTGIEKRQADSAVRKCLGQLSPAHRAVIELVYFQDISTADAARIVGTARGTIKTRLFYARERLLELLGAEGIMAATG